MLQEYVVSPVRLHQVIHTYPHECNCIDQALEEEGITRHPGKALRRATPRNLSREEEQQYQIYGGGHPSIWTYVSDLISQVP